MLESLYSIVSGKGQCFNDRLSDGCYQSDGDDSISSGTCACNDRNKAFHLQSCNVDYNAQFMSLTKYQKKSKSLLE